MGEVAGTFAALVVRHLREAARASGARVRLVILCAFVALAALAGAGGLGGAGRGLAAGLGVLALGLAAQAAAAVQSLPADRAAGRRTWIGTLAPAAALHRLAAAVAGLVAAVGVGLLGGAVLVVALALGPGLPRLQAPVGVPSRVPLLVRAGTAEAAGPAWSLDLEAATGPRQLELDVRPVLLSFDARPRAVPLEQQVGSGGVVVGDVATRGLVRIDLPAGATQVTLRNRGTTAHLRVIGARLLAPDGAAPWAVVLLAGLLLGCALGAVVPLATFASRWTSGATAAGLVGALLLLGVVGRPLLALVQGVDAAPWALGVLGATVRIAPDLGLVPAAQALLEGRLPGHVPALAWGLLVHGALALLLVALPGGETKEAA